MTTPNIEKSQKSGQTPSMFASLLVFGVMIGLILLSVWLFPGEVEAGSLQISMTLATLLAVGMAYQSGAAYTFPYVINDTAYTSVKERNIPPGELALYTGMQIEATDGKVGKLDELVLDKDSGEITHLLMREGHLWGKKEVSVPASGIDFCDSQIIYLKLDKAAVKDLPPISVKRS